MEKKEVMNNLEVESKPMLKTSKFLIDELIDNLQFSRYNLAIIIFCIFSNINDGYLFNYLKFNEKNFSNAPKWTWTNFDYQSIVVGQNILYSTGAILSVYARTSFWDVSSNSLLALIEFITTLILLIFKDPFIWKITMVVYCFCQGYLANLSTNYLLEISPKDKRGGLFILVCGFKFFGQAFFGLILWFISNTTKMNDPNALILGLVFSSALLSLSSMFLVDSPRVLFYNNDTVILIQFFKGAINDEKSFDFNKQRCLQENLDKYKIDNQEFVSSQEIKGHLYDYPELFRQPMKYITFKGMFFAFFSIFIICNVTEIYFHMLKAYNLSNEYLYYKVNYELFLYKLITFIFFTLVSLCIIYFKVSQFILSVLALSSCLILMILIILLKSHFTMFVLFYEAFSFLYFFLVYLYYSDFSTTRLRNSFTSLFYFSFSMAYISQYFITDALLKFNALTPIYVNIVLCCLVLIFDYCFNKTPTLDKGLNEIEQSIYYKIIY